MLPSILFLSGGSNIRIFVVIIVRRIRIEDGRWYFLHLNRRSGVKKSQMFHDLNFQVVQILSRVHIFNIGPLNVKVIFRSEILPVIIIRDSIFQLLSDGNGGFVHPASRYTSDVVTAAAHHKHGNPKRFDVSNAGGMTPGCQVEQSQTILSQRIGATLHHNTRRLKFLDGLVYDRLKYLAVTLIIDAIFKRKIDRIVFAHTNSLVPNISSTWEEHIPKLVERQGHDAIRDVKCLLHTIPVMDINIDIHHTRIIPQHLEDGKYNIIHVAEAGCFRSLGMMETTAPVDSNIRGACHQLSSSVNRRACRHLAKIPQSVKQGTIPSLPSYVKPRQLLCERIAVV
mmetsp:Transcript_11278/g.19256  ORF Transcript_11278/g.19256 Transcript_11278/m.19256 type:complete len:340 (-) Transcript_11278:276-1295(-)